MADVILEVKDLKKYFKTKSGTLHAVDGVSFTIERGKTLGLVGESGCGKSTTGRAILRLIASSGAVAGAVLMAAGIIGFIVVSKKKPKLLLKILCVVSFVIGLFGLLQGTGILSGVPILQVGLPAVLSLYFDVFSGLIQAFVFSLLTMIYISGACPPPEETEKAAS